MASDRERDIRAAEHHIRKARHHGKLKAFYRTFHKAMQDDENDGMDQFQELADAHEEMEGEHADCAEFFTRCAKDGGEPAAKAAGFSNSRTGLVSDRVNGIVPEAPNVRAIPRAGAPTIPARPDVPLEFEKLVSVDDDVIQ
jgi:hypothetical protein